MTSAISSRSTRSARWRTSTLRGGEIARFEAQPFAEDAVRLRRWDDLAKTPGRATPGLDYYLAVLDEVRVPARPLAEH